MLREIITRRHLPHWFVPGATHFVTYRLAGTIPLHVLQFEELHGIAANPVKAGLVREAHQWLFCSAHDRYLQDGSRAGWLLP